MKRTVLRRLGVVLSVVVLSFASLSSPAIAAAGTVGSGNCQSTVGDTTYFTAGTTGNYCLLTFKATTSTSTVTSTWTVPAGVQSVQVLVIGGGGGGGTDIGGGGGGGRVVETTLSVTPGATPTLVAGKGGAPGNGTYSTTSGLDNTGGYTGTSSSFSSTSALGGSGAVGRTKAPANGTASGWDFNGWTSGGGGTNVGSVSAGVGGSAYNGGIGGSLGGGGGGGAGGVGSAGSANGGAGGTGVTTSFTGTSTCYGGGGGGGSNNTAGSATCGGQSGTVSNPTPTAASAGYGGGGGGGGGNGSPNGGQGGSGAVFIKWLPGQVISFTQVTDKNLNVVSSAALTASSTSSLSITFTSTTPGTCSITSSTVNLLAQGSCSITASQSGNASYQAAIDVSMTFSIDGTITLTIASSTPYIYRTTETISVTSASISGKAIFKQGKVRIAGCINKVLNAGNSYTATCTFKPSMRGQITFSVTVIPALATNTSAIKSFTTQVGNRTGNR